MSEPVAGELWRCNGYDFRVDHVSETEVYLVRFADHSELGRPMRIDKSLWVSDMCHAVKIKSA